MGGIITDRASAIVKGKNSIPISFGRGSAGDARLYDYTGRFTVDCKLKSFTEKFEGKSQAFPVTASDTYLTKKYAGKDIWDTINCSGVMYLGHGSCP